MLPPHNPQSLASPPSPLLRPPSHFSMSVCPFESLSDHLFLSVCVSVSLYLPTPHLVTRVSLPDSRLPRLPLESPQGTCVHPQRLENAPGAQPQPPGAWPQSLEGNADFHFFHVMGGAWISAESPLELILSPDVLVHGCPRRGIFP